MTNDEVNYLYKVADITATYSPSLRNSNREDFRQTCALAAVTDYHKADRFDSFASFAKSVVWFTAKNCKRKNWKQALREAPMDSETVDLIEDYRARDRIEEITDDHDKTLLLNKALPKLSVRDLEILDLVYSGNSVKDIGSFLGISYQAVQQRIKVIFRKLQDV